MDVIKALIIFIDFHHKCFDVFIGTLCCEVLSMDHM